MCHCLSIVVYQYAKFSSPVWRNIHSFVFAHFLFGIFNVSLRFIHSSNHLTRLLSFAIPLLCSLVLCGVGIADEKISIRNAQVGIDGHFRVGCWASIKFTVVDLADLPRTLTPIIRTVDPDGHGVTSTLPEILAGSDGVRVQGIFRSGKVEAPVSIEILYGDKIVAQQAIRVDKENAVQCLRQDAQIWILDGDQPAFEAAASDLKKNSKHTFHVANLRSLDQEMTDARSLDSVSLIVLNGDTNPPETTASAIRDWTRRGGRLVICVGGDVDQIQSGTLSSWLPVQPREKIEIRNLTGISQLVPGSSPLRFLGTVSGARFRATDGTVIASELGHPLAIRNAYGVGTVTMIGLRLDQKPLSTWNSRAELAIILAGLESIWKEAIGEQQAAAFDTGLNPTGVTDLQTQLIHTLDHYENIPRPSYLVVLGWSAVLILLIGPIDYFIMHRLIGRPQYTWFTLPIWLIAMTLWSYSSTSSTNEAELQAKQIELLDVDLTVNKIRGRSWLNFYSPETRRNTIEVDLQSISIPTNENSVDYLSTSWIERPEFSYRGMYRSGGLDTQKPTYRLRMDNRGIENFPTRVWSTGSVASEWEVEINPGTFVEANLNDPGTGRLTGTLTYRGDQELSEWFIAYGNFAYFPKSSRRKTQQSLKQGDTFDLRTARSNMLRGVLTGQTQTSIFNDRAENKFANISREEYDSLSREPYRVLRTLSFHEMISGSSYTKLGNESLDDADLSKLLELHRAVLVGKFSTPITKFAINGKPAPCVEQDVVVRVILSVEFELTDVDAPPDPSLLKTN